MLPLQRAAFRLAERMTRPEREPPTILCGRMSSGGESLPVSS
jgi:hypothetical protein